MFGVVNTVATLDHLDPPQPPKCITMLYVFAETYVWLASAMWNRCVVSRFTPQSIYETLCPLQALWQRHQRLAVQVSVGILIHGCNEQNVEYARWFWLILVLCAGTFTTTLVEIMIKSSKNFLQPSALLPSPPCGWAHVSWFISGPFSTALASTLSCGWPSSSPFHHFLL